MIWAFGWRGARGSAPFRPRIRRQRRLPGIRKYLEFQPKFSKFRFLDLLAYAHPCMGKRRRKSENCLEAATSTDRERQAHFLLPDDRLETRFRSSKQARTTKHGLSVWFFIILPGPSRGAPPRATVPGSGLAQTPRSAHPYKEPRPPGFPWKEME